MRTISPEAHALNRRLADVVFELTDAGGSPLYALAGELAALLPSEHRERVDDLMTGVSRWRDLSVRTALKVSYSVQGFSDLPEPPDAA